MPTQSLYQDISGEVAVREFVGYFYEYLEMMSAFSDIRELYPDDLNHTKEALFMYLSGMLGGPPLYTQAYGPADLRQKHKRIKISNKVRDQWLQCAQRAANKLKIDPIVRYELMHELTVMANHLCNQSDCAHKSHGVSA